MLRILTFILILLSTQGVFAWNTPAVGRTGNAGAKWTWTGAGANSLWTNGSNWCGTFRNGACVGASGGPPTTGASLIFDATCVANANNCTPTAIPAGPFTFIGIHFKTGFPGVVNFGTTTVTVSNNFLLEVERFRKRPELLQ